MIALILQNEMTYSHKTERF